MYREYFELLLKLVSDVIQLSDVRFWNVISSFICLILKGQSRWCYSN